MRRSGSKTSTARLNEWSRGTFSARSSSPFDGRTMTLEVEEAITDRPARDAGPPDDSASRKGPVKRALGWVFAQATRALFATFRALGPERSIRFGSWLGRRIGPLTP